MILLLANEHGDDDDDDDDDDAAVFRDDLLRWDVWDSRQEETREGEGAIVTTTSTHRHDQSVASAVKELLEISELRQEVWALAKHVFHEHLLCAALGIFLWIVQISERHLQHHARFVPARLEENLLDPFRMEF